LGDYSNALQNLTNAPAFSLTGEHYLFNSGTWKMMRDGRLVKMTKTGIDALSVTNIQPLYFTIALKAVTPPGFTMTAAHSVGRPQEWYATNGEPATLRKPYPIVGVGTNSAGGNPSELVLRVQIPDTQEIVSVSSNAPYKSVERYEVDMKYSGSDITNVFTKKHLEDVLSLPEESFKIIAIASNTVTVQDTRMGQKTELVWNAGGNAAAVPDTKTGQKTEKQGIADSKP